MQSVEESKKEKNRLDQAKLRARAKIYFAYADLFEKLDSEGRLLESDKQFFFDKADKKDLHLLLTGEILVDE